MQFYPKSSSGIRIPRVTFSTMNYESLKPSQTKKQKKSFKLFLIKLFYSRNDQNAEEKFHSSQKN